MESFRRHVPDLYFAHFLLVHFALFRLLRRSRSKKIVNRCSILMSSSTTKKSFKKESQCISGMTGSGTNSGMLLRISRPSISLNVKDKTRDLLPDLHIFQITCSIHKLLMQCIDIHLLISIFSLSQISPSFNLESISKSNVEVNYKQ